ncbi:WhiB family transcriptional regulator [Ilumatobacter coccineus]|uniref:Putative WhiB family transcriptional regulator n=1 Tax=Ilumatobacter coccineus (strain NBRC 103263 / KCTC 29153 / YM16-304) TaxID=1313172 RepID=A0A6C7EJM6_ILUCY|nr:WhiB family transcriptional regulator [Ilumatobacter coccineus]BAN04166.1 putative WhiB family transcriptional regulator [Ilumatobacter coccineus YM16-304]
MDLTIALTDTRMTTSATGRSAAVLDAPDTLDETPFEMSDLDTSYPRCSDGNGTLSHLFFSDDDYELARAKSICSACGLKDDCLNDAIERSEPYGVWGGKLVLDGVPVEFKRKRGRPRKNPLPVLVVDEVPAPPHRVA